MPLHVLIVDDEAPARARLRRLLLPYVDAGRMADPDEAADGIDALAVLQDRREPVDLLFLDVRMPGADGFEVLDRLLPEHRPAVVFTTAYDEYALRAFEANAIDYLLKPIDAERLAQTVDRAERSRSTRDDGTRADRLAELLEDLDRAALDRPDAQPTAPAAPLTQFTVQVRDRLVVVSTDHLIAAEVQDGITNLFVQEGGAIQRHIVSYPLDTIESRLDPNAFMRVHRGALVRLGAIREMVPWFSGRYKLVLDGGHEVTASRARSRDLRERLSL